MSGGRHSTFVISLTPFTEDGELDEAGLRAHLGRLRASGIGVYLAGSGSGEGYTLTRAERRRVLEVGAEELAGAVPVRAMGVEPRTAAEVIELAEDAVAAGVDATQVYSLDLGHGYLPTADEQRAFLRTVLDRAPGDLVLSTHPSVGYHYEPALLDEVLTEYPHVIGVNATHRDLVYVAEVVDTVNGRVDVHVGGPMHALGATALGATGYLSSEGNLAPRLCVAVIEHIDRGDRDRAAHSHGHVIELHEATQALGGIVGAKAALRLLGAPGGWPRPPRLPVAPERAQSLVDVLVRLGVASSEGLR
ncbi:MAG TPA: dihydrodipicolinate synthase family protein [Acidimicrobiia bacterium]|nr:dihydrodipicolinate synthase family protein [Acidimicrobiia bacterium]